MKRLLVMATALSLTACTGFVPASFPTVAPAPLSQTVIDDTALHVAWQAFDAALDGINLLIDAKVIKIGSHKAMMVANGVDRVKAGLTAAESAASAGSTTDYKVALAEARAAITQLRLTLKGN